MRSEYMAKKIALEAVRLPKFAAVNGDRGCQELWWQKIYGNVQC